MRQTGATSEANFIFCDDAMSEVYEFFHSTVLLSPGLLVSILVNFLTVNYIITIGSLFSVLVRLKILTRHPIYPNDHVRIWLESPWMRRDLIVAFFFLFHKNGAPIDTTLSSRCDTIGTNHNWTELWFLIIDERQCTYPAHHTMRF